MCGLAGFLGPITDRRGAASLLTRMAAEVSHRGPDDHGHWIAESEGIGFAHRRLSIVDLSQAGHQPMASSSGRYVITYNGEIYNHRAIRTELERAGCTDWRGGSDTETLLDAIETWGLESALKRTKGMFALALWDRREHTLFLARDRVGEKPLYYGWTGSGDASAFLFASDLASISVHPNFDAALDPQAIEAFLRYGYVPAPRSIYAGFSKLEPGTVLTVSLQRRVPAIAPYWSVQDMIARASATPFQGSPAEAVDELETVLKDAIGLEMMADVPTGAFLSGGIDSSTIVALMQAQSTHPVATFTIGFGDAEHNEAIEARAIAAHLETRHTELTVTPQMALDVIPALPDVYSEPFADSSQIPVRLVSALARTKVTVALSGDGGDELFGGYNRYLLASRYLNKIHSIPRPLRQGAAWMIDRANPDVLGRLAGRLQALMPGTGQSQLSAKIAKLSRGLRTDDAAGFYRQMASIVDAPQELMAPEIAASTRGDCGAAAPERSGSDAIHAMMAADLVSYLPDDILCKVDRASMSVSLECRAPFLDHDVISFAWRLPIDLKIRNSVGKWPLRELLSRYVPRHLVDRPKKGFAVPLDAWLRGPLRAWAEDLLSPQMIARQGLLDEAAVSAVWRDHLAGRRNAGPTLWNILTLQAWSDAHRPGRSVASPLAAVA